MITGNVIGSVLKNPSTLILIDEYGNEHTAAMTGQEVELTATTNDVRLGKVAALETGVKTGEKVIPAYHVREGYKITPNGSSLFIKNGSNLVDDYDYSKLQILICLFNSSISNSVATEKVAINTDVYDVKSAVSISTITKDHDTKTINLGITNDSGLPWIIRYFYYKEIN